MREWLKEKREDKNLSQQELADKVEISQQYYSFIEKGNRRPSTQVAKKIATILGFDWTIFF